MKKTFTLSIVLVLLCGVFGDEVKMSVMEGDSVTLHTDLTDMRGVMRIMWRVGEEGSKSLLVGIYADHTIDVVDSDDVVRFKDRLQVNNQTGDLTIKNMRFKHSGLYEAEIIINSGGTTYKNFRVTVYDSPTVISARAGDVKSVSVNEGESVTLVTDLKDIQNDSLILWRFGDEGLLIAKEDKEDNKSPIYDDKGFRGRLKLDDQTGSLTISDVRSSDSGLYKLKINNNNQILYKTFSVYVRGLSSGAIAGLSAFLAVCAVCVFAGGLIFYLHMSEVKKLMNEMKSVSVTEGDSVTLHTDVTKLQSDDHVIEWRFGDKKVAKVNKKDNSLFVYDDVLDGIFKGRLKLNDETGSLTITNINMRHAGLYKVKMSSGEGTSCSHFITRSGHLCSLFNVVVQAQIKSVSVMEGESVTLPADLTDKHTDAVIEWMFKDEDAVIARFSRKKKKVSMYGEVLDGRFRNILQVNNENGHLTISDVNIRHAGVYKLWIIATTGVSFSHFNIIVKERIRLAVLGQAVTLITGVTEMQTDDDIQWVFGPQESLIALLNAGSSKYEINDCNDVRFRDRLNLNQRTGSVTIANITVKHSGVYQVRIISSSRRTKYKKFSVTISVLTKRGETVTLNTESEIQRGSEIQWIFHDDTILVTGKNGEDRETRYTNDERFTDGLKMNPETGDLTITDITTEHNGVYKLQQINGDGKILYRMFSVCVIDSDHGTASNNQKSDLRGISNVMTPLLNGGDV